MLFPCVDAGAPNSDHENLFLPLLSYRGGKVRQRPKCNMHLTSFCRGISRNIGVESTSSTL